MKSTATTAPPLLTHPCSATISSHIWPSANPNTTLPLQYPKFYSHVGRLIGCNERYRRLDSNSRTVRTQNSFNFNSGEDDVDDDDFGPRRRQWWSDNPRSATDQEPGILEEFIDSIWFFKALRSYGLMLPVIFISMVLATGPKAFLMSLALPMGQSALTLAFKKLWGRTHDNPKRWTNAKIKQKVGPTSNVKLEEEEESQGNRKEAMGYHSWVARDDVSANKDCKDSSPFKGWDELDRTKDLDMESLRRSAKTGRSGRMRVEKGKFSKRKRKTDAPLLLRLLISVFPFLGSWTKML